MKSYAKPHFQIIRAGQTDNAQYLDSMHNLRYSIFYEQMNWRKGLNIKDYREYDEYDTPDTIYIVRINAKGAVDASCRLISTTGHYMLADHYSDFVETSVVPHTDSVWEISRFCISTQMEKLEFIYALSQLIAASLEFGISHKLKEFIALVSEDFLKLVNSVTAWNPYLLGAVRSTPEDRSCAVLYDVNPDILDKIKTKWRIDAVKLLC